MVFSPICYVYVSIVCWVTGQTEIPNLALVQIVDR